MSAHWTGVVTGRAETTTLSACVDRTFWDFGFLGSFSFCLFSLAVEVSYGCQRRATQGPASAQLPEYMNGWELTAWDDSSNVPVRFRFSAQHAERMEFVLHRCGIETLVGAGELTSEASSPRLIDLQRSARA